MTPTNMQLPPPCVSGTAIPANMTVKNSAYDDYMEAQERRKAAEQRIREKMQSSVIPQTSRTSQNSGNKMISDILKLALGIGIAVGGFFGIKSLIKHFKK